MPLSAPASHLGPASIGPYRVLRELGAGATARVYEAIHPGLDKHVAIKVLSRRSEAAERRFLREGKAAARVRHPHVVDVVDIGASPHGLYLVMEKVDGGTLAARIPRPGEADLDSAITWLLPVISAVAAAHAAGVVHRDLKPSNILVAFDARGGLHPKVADFGISKIDDAEVPLTGEDGLLGTPGFMAPEQIADPRTAGPASDQYSLGVLLHLFTTGVLPYEADTPYELMRRVLDGELVAPHERSTTVSPALSVVIARALARSPDARFPSVHALGRALLPFASARTRAIWAPELDTEATIGPEGHADVQGPGQTLDDGAPDERLPPVGSHTLDDRAPEVPIPPPRATSTARRRLAVVVVAATAMGLAMLAGSFLRAQAPTASGADAPLSGPFFANATPARTPVPEAAREYRLGLAAMRDSAWESGVAHFERAARLDPELGVAHLRLAMALGGPEPEARLALARAQVLRDGLSERDRAFLDALEPRLFASPPDERAHVERLRAAVARFPRDAELVMHLAIALQAEPTWAEAEALADRALALSPDYPDALQTKARARAHAGHVDEALAGLARCTDLAPLAIGCLRSQARVREAAGRCEGMAPVLRRWMTVEPRAFEPQLLLAGLLASERRPREAIEEPLRQRWQRAPAEDRVTREQKDRVRLALYDDDLAGALRLLAGLRVGIEGSPDPEDHAWAAEHEMFALEASGQGAVAARVAQAHIARAQAWSTRSELVLRVTVEAASAARRQHLLDAAGALAAVAASIPAAAPGPLAPPLRSETLALALAGDRDEAQAALAALPGGPDAVPRELLPAFARALTLAGRAAEARDAHLRNVSGCDGLSVSQLTSRRALAAQ